ncbi:aldo/keto reductase [Thalassoroseus pseudoceratinae]|uniref:aldo/keto reductase n=1 Tax=Thalassoroseus pseudoceratinae TaxID=2713176 RepID=UPI00141E7F1A|nr:aldo/keto reductase [Thalassoroseus pseudoceratinae]
MQSRALGRTGLNVSPIGFGAFKIGRNQNIKYPSGYDLPDESSASRILNSVLDAGITYIDTAPAYGLSEERIGRHLANRREEFTLSSKIGETFENGVSTYSFTADSVRSSVERSLQRLQTDRLDAVFIHSNGKDLDILQNTDAVPTLQDLKQSGKIRAIGLSGKTPAGAAAALDWADVLMVEYHLEDRSHEEVLHRAANAGIGVVIKKGLAAGHLSASEALEFLFSDQSVSSVVVGSLNLDHIQANIAIAEHVDRKLSSSD